MPKKTPGSGDALKFPLSPMEAALVDKIPEGPEWQYEPKWDGFRCIVFHDKGKVILQSKAKRQLGRYFPELIEDILQLSAANFILDGEIVVPVEGGIDFNQLLQRIHPAASRVQKLSREHPAHLVVFDFLSDEKGQSLLNAPLSERREKLEAFARRYFTKAALVHLSPATRDISEAKDWLNHPGSFIDGVVAKQINLPYVPGKRAMAKFKRIRTADCVVGGFRYAEKSKIVGSLLLGLYDDEGKLNHVGFTSGIKTPERAALVKKLQPLIEPPWFTGKAPGGPSRWSTERSAQWEPLRPQLLVEVSFDHVTDNRFRHGTRLLRWRPDKNPRQCTMEQLGSPRSNNFFFKLVS